MEPAVLLSVAVAAVAVATGTVAALLAARSRRRALQARLDASTAEVDALRHRVDDLSRRLDDDRTVALERAEPREFVITTLADGTLRETQATQGDHAPAAHLTAGQFASVAVGESVVRLLSLGYGVRRALSPENRNRIRFEVRREVKRARKQRRRDLKEAKRHLRTVTPSAEEDAA